MERPIRRKPNIKKKNLNAKQLTFLAGCVIGAAALIVAACFIFGGVAQKEEPWEPKPQPQRTSMPELTLGDMTRRDTMMVVGNSYLNLEFPYMFSDYIYVRAINQEKAAALEFRVRTSTMDEVLYTIWFNGMEDHWKHLLGSISNTDRIGSYDPGDGQGPVEVTVVFYKLPAQLSQDDQGTFKAAQETANEVIASANLSSKFTP